MSGRRPGEGSTGGLAERLGDLVDRLMDRTVAPGYTRIGYAVRKRLPGWPADPAPDALADRDVLVTGASSGLGVQTARELAALGARVHLVVRDRGKGESEMADLEAEAGPVFRLWTCDLGDLDDVRRLAGELVAAGVRPYVVVHNAGAMPPRRTESPQGHELSMALHVLAPVLLTDLLLPVLPRGARVVLVTSGGMYAQRLRADDPDYLRGEYSPTTAYARSKRAQVELLPVLQRRWGLAGVTVHATHPGWADTPGVVDSLPTFHRLTGPFLRDLHQGTDTTTWLAATQPPPAGGELWHDRRARPFALTSRTRASEADRDVLWRWVRAQVDLAE